MASPSVTAEEPDNPSLDAGPMMDCCASSRCWATMKQNQWLQAKWHRRWLSGPLLRQAEASLNLGAGHQAKSGYKYKSSYRQYTVRSACWHGSDAIISTEFSRHAAIAVLPSCGRHKIHHHMQPL
ncbi:hypothetical protein TGAM01_v208545 [Trichoderma gamsii]|uniref:Uncharacterized protein n=1 Tax=Trichoderma gamsii TaxID=398673 RepID=A0A2P4ZEF5_9HYPO|nr:hypothetical protein TGAM01_v208545 [Trichoderma gamsii]PON22656.1 hypothetical protein TGAM01_v208545 [Trichoderma gamsii]